MVIEVSEFYKEKGYIKAYLNTNRENRKVVSLYKEDKTNIWISYAKYLYTSYYKIDLPKDIEVDHINNDKTDDRIENLQTISKRYNIQKDHKKKELVLLTCPICGVEFLFEKRNLSTHPDPCCSKECGYKKAYKTKVSKGLKLSYTHFYSKKCKLCGKVIKNYTTGKKYCSNECREKDKNYPTFNEVTEQYQKLGTWKKVAEYFNVSYKIIQNIRKREH